MVDPIDRKGSAMRLRVRSSLVAVALLAMTSGLLAALGGTPASADQASSDVRRVAAASVATGDDHTCALTRSGAVRCWGKNDYAQLGYGHTEHIGDDETPASIGNVRLGGTAVALTAGYRHTCALMNSGRVRCWGHGTSGQLGYGNTATIGDDETPASAGTVPLGGKAVAITAGGLHTCALMKSGRVRCWGDNGAGRLGYANAVAIGDDETPASAGDISLGGRATAVDAGDGHTCALMRSGALRCWGRGDAGQLGYGNTEHVGDGETPASAGDVPLGGRAVAVTAGSYHSCAVLRAGQVRCWGSSEGTFGFGGEGRLGYGNTEIIGDDETPASAGNVQLSGNAMAVTAGTNHTCALLRSGELNCWGQAGFGQLGYGNTVRIGDDESPTAAGTVPLGGSAVAVAAGGAHTCATLRSGRLRCWGYGYHGALGYGNRHLVGTSTSTTPASVGNVPVGTRVRTKAATRLTLHRKPRRDRRAPYVYRVRGQVKGAFAKDAATCGGKVKIKVKRGKRRLVKKTAWVRNNCTYRKKLKIRRGKLGTSRRVKLKIVAKFTGTTNLGRDKARRRAVAN